MWLWTAVCCWMLVVMSTDGREKAQLCMKQLPRVTLTSSLCFLVSVHTCLQYLLHVQYFQLWTFAVFSIPEYIGMRQIPTARMLLHTHSGASWYGIEFTAILVIGYHQSKLWATCDWQNALQLTLLWFFNYFIIFCHIFSKLVYADRSFAATGPCLWNQLPLIFLATRSTALCDFDMQHALDVTQLWPVKSSLYNNIAYNFFTI